MKHSSTEQNAKNSLAVS